MWKINKILFPIVGLMLLGSLVYACYANNKIVMGAVTKPMFIKIGDFTYKIIYTQASLGSTAFQLDDSKGSRVMILPESEDQLRQSFIHEELHACIHNHQHSFKTSEELTKHLRQSYSEEDVVEILAPCLLKLKEKSAMSF